MFNYQGVCLESTLELDETIYQKYHETHMHVGVKHMVSGYSRPEPAKMQLEAVAN